MHNPPDGFEGADDSYLDVTAQPGVVVDAIVVKGGNAYNDYRPGQNGLSASGPWTNLISPFNGGGNIGTISHWFACYHLDEVVVVDPCDPCPVPVLETTVETTTTPAPAAVVTPAAPAAPAAPAVPEAPAVEVAGAEVAGVQAARTSLPRTGGVAGTLACLGFGLLLAGVGVALLATDRRVAIG